MNEQEINVAIAKACGWSRIEPGFLDSGRAHPLFSKSALMGTPHEDMDKPEDEQSFKPIPDYCHDLNAMHEAEKTLSDTREHDQWSRYCVELNRLCCRITCGDNPLCGYTIHATARQRAETFLKTKGLWKE